MNKRKFNNHTSIDQISPRRALGNESLNHENETSLLSKRSDYYSKLGIEDHNRLNKWRSNSLNRSTPFNHFNRLNDSMRSSDLKSSGYKNARRTTSSERLLKLNFLLKK